MPKYQHVIFNQDKWNTQNEKWYLLWRTGYGNVSNASKPHQCPHFTKIKRNFDEHIIHLVWTSSYFLYASIKRKNAIRVKLLLRKLCCTWFSIVAPSYPSATSYSRWDSAIQLPSTPGCDLYWPSHCYWVPEFSAKIVHSDFYTMSMSEAELGSHQHI